jgi:hypothetical protein
LAYLVGVVVALAVGAVGTFLGLDRDRAYYPTVLIVTASYYALFAVMGGSSHALLIESVAVAAAVALAGIGFKRSLWYIVAGLAMHGALDLVHGALINNPGVPAWWPGFCLSFDVAAAAYLAALVVRRPALAHAR